MHSSEIRRKAAGIALKESLSQQRAKLQLTNADEIQGTSI